MIQDRQTSLYQDPQERKTQKLVLVTGASGFVGRHLVRLLSELGHNVRALFNKDPPDASLAGFKNVRWQQCDLLDIFDIEEAMDNVAQVYHCAAIVSFLPAAKQQMMHFNVESTANLVNEAVARGVDKFLFVSSVAALGRSGGKKIITEEEQWEESNHNTRYGLSKYLSELEVWRGAGEGLNTVIVNPGIILGEGNWEEGSARLMKVVYKEFPFYTQGINAWVDVQDVVSAMVRLMDSNISNERFILSVGNFAYRDIFTRMANALGKKPPSIPAGALLTSLVWRWSMFRSLIFGETATITKETARSSQRQVYYDNSKLVSFLPGFSYRSLDATIKRMAVAFLKEKE